MNPKGSPGYNGKLPDDSVNVSSEHPLQTAIKLIFSLSIIAIVGYFAVHFLINKAVDVVTPEQEKEIQALFDGDINESNDSRLNAVLHNLARCANLPYDIKLHIDNTDEVNAFAVPGGYIYLTKGILAKIESENELAFVLGHELGHFKHKDYLRSMGYKLTLYLVAKLLGSNYGTAASIPLTISSAKYSQSQEFAADAYGLEVMNCAYGTVNGATRIFEKMDDGKEWMHFVATHPGFKKRIETMRKISAKKGYDTSKKLIPMND